MAEPAANAIEPSRSGVIGSLICRIRGDHLTGLYLCGQPLKNHGQFEQIVSAVRKSRLPRKEPQDRSAIPALFRSRHPHQTRHGRVRTKLLTSKLRNTIVNGEFRGVAIGCPSVAGRTRSARRPGLRRRGCHSQGACARRQQTPPDHRADPEQPPLELQHVVLFRRRLSRRSPRRRHPASLSSCSAARVPRILLFGSMPKREAAKYHRPTLRHAPLRG